MLVRVFIVEDLQRMERLLADLFATLDGFAVVATAPTEAEAYQWLDMNQGQWDLAVVDLVLEQGTGFGVITRCRAQPTGGRVVVFSSYITPAIREHCMNLGANAVFAKAEAREFLEYCGSLPESENAT